MNVLALCAGTSGIELGLKIADPATRCVCYVEGEAYVAANLVSRMEDEALDSAPVWSDVRSFDGNPWRGKVDFVAGGYPCQCYSLSGSRKGKDDPRYLWPHIARILSEVEPEWAFFENVQGHLSLGFETVANDLQGMGFAVAAGLFSAREVGSPQGRQRLFILAHSQRPIGREAGSYGCSPTEQLHRLPKNREEDSSGVGVSSQVLDDRLSVFPPEYDDFETWASILADRPDLGPATESQFRGMVNGLAGGMDTLRIAACGNGVVPLVAAYAYEALRASL